MVETALVLPVLFVLALGIIYGSEVFNENQTLTQATASVARFVSICDSATSGNANAIGDNAAASLHNTTNNLSFSYTTEGNTYSNVSANCSQSGANPQITSGDIIVITGSATANPGSLNLGLFTVSLPTLTNTVTVTEQ